MLMAKKKPKAEVAAWPDRLKALRAKYSLTQVEAAERVGVAARTWISWENDQRTPGRLTLRLLKSAFPTDF